MTAFEALGNLLFRRRNILFPLLLLAVFAAFPCRPAGAAPALAAIGFVVLALGQGLRVVTIGLDYIRRGGRNGRIHADRLVTGGVFAHCRNPMYTGNIAMALGFLLIAGNPIGVAVGTVLACVAYAAIVAGEEAYLGASFGDAYRDYCRGVPRWLPRMRGLLETLRGYRFDWAAVVIREYNTLYSTALIVLLLLAWKQGRAGALPPLLPTYAGVAAAFTLAYVTARYLKKSRRLTAIRN